MRTSHVPIESPCHESWEAMEGGAERRFCGVCQKHVHDLSAMRHDDALALLRASAGEHLCVRYSAEADGALRFRDLVPRSRLTRGIRRAAFAAVLLAACGPTIDAPVPEIAEVIVDRITHATEVTPDGGCKFATGPFTTFHFPPGHAFCGAVDHAAGATPTSPASKPLSGPGPFDPVIDPIARPTMGAAIADPGPVEPFVPCDPMTNPVAAPPHLAPSPPTPRVMSPEPRPLMGDVAIPGPGYAYPPSPPNPFPGAGFAPPPPSNPFPGAGFAPPPPPMNPSPRSGPTPPPTPNPFPASVDPPAPPPDPPPLMGSIRPTVDTRMGRVAPPR